MHLLYVDESGDTGRNNPENHTFVLCGLLVHHADWHVAQGAFIRMRQRLREKYGYPESAELHAAEMLGRGELHHGINRPRRIQAILHAVEMARRETSLTPIRILLRKDDCKTDIAPTAWAKLLGATHVKLPSRKDGPTLNARRLLVICDDHRTAPADLWLGELRGLLDLDALLIDEPFGRDSHRSHFLQMCDVLAYLSRQSIEPNALFRQSHAQTMLKRTERLFKERGITLDFSQEEGGAFAPP
jgi:hypothetical protein